MVQSKLDAILKSKDFEEYLKESEESVWGLDNLKYVGVVSPINEQGRVHGIYQEEFRIGEDRKEGGVRHSATLYIRLNLQNKEASTGVYSYTVWISSFKDRDYSHKRTISFKINDTSEDIKFLYRNPFFGSNVKKGGYSVYLEHKKLRYDYATYFTKGSITYVPYFDIEGYVKNIQVIFKKEGVFQKLFLSDVRKKGGYAFLNYEEFTTAGKRIAITEGWATGYTVYQEMSNEYTVIAAGSAHDVKQAIKDLIESGRTEIDVFAENDPPGLNTANFAHCLGLDVYLPETEKDMNDQYVNKGNLNTKKYEPSMGGQAKETANVLFDVSDLELPTLGKINPINKHISHLQYFYCRGKGYCIWDNKQKRFFWFDSFALKNIKNLADTGFDYKQINFFENLIHVDGVEGCFTAPHERVILRHGKKYLNTFIGLIPKKPASKNKDKVLTAFLTLVDKCLVTNKEDREYLLRWTLDLIKKPFKAKTVHPVLLTKTQGTGKSLFCEMVSNLFPEYKRSMSANELFGGDNKFNTWAFAENVLIVVNEFELKKGQNKEFKRFAADKKMEVRQKYENGTERERVANMIMTSNIVNRLGNLERGDRRLHVIFCKEKKMEESNPGMLDMLKKAGLVDSGWYEEEQVYSDLWWGLLEYESKIELKDLEKVDNTVVKERLFRGDEEDLDMADLHIMEMVERERRAVYKTTELIDLLPRGLQNERGLEVFKKALTESDYISKKITYGVGDKRTSTRVFMKEGLYDKSGAELKEYADKKTKLEDVRNKETKEETPPDPDDTPPPPPEKAPKPLEHTQEQIYEAYCEDIQLDRRTEMISRRTEMISEDEDPERKGIVRKLLPDHTIVYMDFETYSEEDVRNIGSFKYSKHPTTKMICVAYAVYRPEDLNTAEVKVYTTIPEELKDLINNEKTALVAFNVGFERNIWKNTLKLPERCRWVDAAKISVALGYGRSLEDAAMQINKKEFKDEKAKVLRERFFYPPPYLKNGQLPERLRDLKIEEVYEYCRQDVVAMRTIDKNLEDNELSKEELEIQEVDMYINEKGIKVDTQLAGTLAKIYERQVMGHIEEFKKQNEGLSPMQKKKLKTHIKEKYGIEVSSLGKEARRELKKNNKELSELIEGIDGVPSTTSSKYTTLLESVDGQGIYRDAFRYYGAHTGRWAGWGVQIHNLPRLSDKKIEVEDVLKGQVELEGEDVHRLVRPCFISRENHKLLVMDLKTIEPRVVAFLARDEELIDIFNTDKDLYKQTYAAISGKPEDEVTKDERKVGKTIALGLQYGMGAKKLVAKIKHDTGIIYTEEEGQQIVNKWRVVRKPIVKYWKQLEKQFESNIIKRKAYGKVETFLELLSGRVMYYRHIQEREEELFGYLTMQYFSKTGHDKEEKYTGKIYGGLLTENVTQATARDVLCHSMMEVYKQLKLLPVIHVHDELVYEIEEGNEAMIEKIKQIAEQNPIWLGGVKIEYEVQELSERYTK